MKNWIGTWVSAQQLTEPHNMPEELGLSNNTLRQIIHTTIGGEQIRVKFSNIFGKESLEIRSVTIATHGGSGSIDLNTTKELRFNNCVGVVIKPGESVISDPLEFDLSSDSDIAVSIYFGEVPDTVTGHPGSRSTSYIKAGNVVFEKDMGDGYMLDHWYILSGLDVLTDEDSRALVIIGDSLTDGRGSTHNMNRRWPNYLFKRFLQNPETRNISVLNQGIGGNCVIKEGLGDCCIDRFKRDVIEQSGVKYLILLEGINDIGTTDPMEQDGLVEKLIEAYRSIINTCHQHNIKIYGATIPPFYGHEYYCEEREVTRKKINYWIRNSGEFDGFIDMDLATCDERESLKLMEVADSEDHLHLSDEGYSRMADAVDLNLFLKK